MLQAALDEHLRLRPRDEHSAIDLERQPAEAPFPEDVRQRFPQAPAFLSRIQTMKLFLAELVISAVDLGARDAEDVRDHAHRFEGGHAAAASSRLRRRSSAASASVNSSRSPSTIRSSLLMVRLTRWSLTRLSG